MTRSARAAEARTPARTRRRSAAAGRIGGGGVAIFPRPDRIGELASRRCEERSWALNPRGRSCVCAALRCDSAKAEEEPQRPDGSVISGVCPFGCDLKCFCSLCVTDSASGQVFCVGFAKRFRMIKYRSVVFFR